MVMDWQKWEQAARVKEMQHGNHWHSEGDFQKKNSSAAPVQTAASQGPGHPPRLANPGPPSLALPMKK